MKFLHFTTAATHAVFALLLSACRTATLGVQGQQRPEVQASEQRKQNTAMASNVRDLSNEFVERKKELKNQQSEIRALSDILASKADKKLQQDESQERSRNQAKQECVAIVDKCQEELKDGENQIQHLVEEKEDQQNRATKEIQELRNQVQQAKKGTLDAQNQTLESNKIALNQILEATKGAQIAKSQYVECQKDAQHVRLQAQQFQKEAQDLQMELQRVKAAARKELEDVRNQFVQVTKEAEEMVKQANKDKEDALRALLEHSRAPTRSSRSTKPAWSSSDRSTGVQNQVAPEKIPSDEQNLVQRNRETTVDQNARPSDDMVGNGTCSFYVEKSREMEKQAKTLQTTTEKLKIEIETAHAETEAAQAELASHRRNASSMGRYPKTTRQQTWPTIIGRDGTQCEKALDAQQKAFRAELNEAQIKLKHAQAQLAAQGQNGTKIGEYPKTVTCEDEIESQQETCRAELRARELRCQMNLFTLGILSFKYHHVTFCFGGGQEQHFVT